MPGGDLWGGCLCVPPESGSPALTILATALALCAINSLFPTRVAYDTSPHHLATLLLIFAMMARLARGFSVGNLRFAQPYPYPATIIIHARLTHGQL